MFFLGDLIGYVNKVGGFFNRRFLNPKADTSLPFLSDKRPHVSVSQQGISPASPRDWEKPSDSTG